MNTDMLNEARRASTDVVEEIGAVCMHLREAMDFTATGSVENAAASVDDALNAIDTTVKELLNIRDRAGRWAVWAQGKEKA